MKNPLLTTVSRSLLIQALLLSGSVAHAAGGDSAYVGMGSLGLGVGYGLPLSERWGLRLGLNSGTPGSLKTGDSLEGVYYEIEGRVKGGLSALADFYPIHDSGFRLTGGLVYAPFKADLKGRPEADGYYNLNGNRYAASQVGNLSGQVKYHALSPYLGVGWESKPLGQAGWRMVTDIGVYYLGKSSVNLAADGAGSNAALRRDLEAERGSLEDKGVGLIISLGAAYAF